MFYRQILMIWIKSLVPNQLRSPRFIWIKRYVALMSPCCTTACRRKHREKMYWQLSACEDELVLRRHEPGVTSGERRDSSVGQIQKSHGKIHFKNCLLKMNV